MTCAGWRREKLSVKKTKELLRHPLDYRSYSYWKILYEIVLHYKSSGVRIQIPNVLILSILCHWKSLMTAHLYDRITYLPLWRNFVIAGEWAGFMLYIRNVLSSNIGSESGSPEIFIVVLSRSNQMSEYYLTLGKDIFRPHAFQFIIN
jgi:hypothetical protein